MIHLSECQRLKLRFKEDRACKVVCVRVVLTRSMFLMEKERDMTKKIKRQ